MIIYFVDVILKLFVSVCLENTYIYIYAYIEVLAVAVGAEDEALLRLEPNNDK